MERIGLHKGAFFLFLALCAALDMAPDASAATAVTYRDAAWNATTKTMVLTQKSVTSYTEVVSDSTSWSAGWHVVKSDVTISSRIAATGDVKLILCDGATLTAPGGINVAAGNSLTI